MDRRVMRAVFAIIWGHAQLPGRRQETRTPCVIEFDTTRGLSGQLEKTARRDSNMYHCGFNSPVNEYRSLVVETRAVIIDFFRCQGNMSRPLEMTRDGNTRFTRKSYVKYICKNVIFHRYALYRNKMCNKMPLYYCIDN